MTKPRLLATLLVFVGVDLILVNQNWFFGTVGDAGTEVSVTGAKLFVSASPVLTLLLLTTVFGFYVKSKVTSIALGVESLIVAGLAIAAFEAGLLPGQAIARTGLVEELTGQTGTVEELGYLIASVTISPAFYLALAFMAITAIWAGFAAIRAWRWKAAPRAQVAANNRGKSKKTSFDLWDSQR